MNTYRHTESHQIRHPYFEINGDMIRYMPMINEAIPHSWRIGLINASNQLVTGSICRSLNPKKRRGNPMMKSTHPNSISWTGICLVMSYSSESMFIMSFFPFSDVCPLCLRQYPDILNSSALQPSNAQLRSPMMQSICEQEYAFLRHYLLGYRFIQQVQEQVCPKPMQISPAPPTIW